MIKTFYFLLFLNFLNAYNIYYFTDFRNIIKYRICKNINYNQVLTLKNNSLINNIYIQESNRFILFELKNNSIYNYKNTKRFDLLGILPIINIFK